MVAVTVIIILMQRIVGSLIVCVEMFVDVVNVTATHPEEGIMELPDLEPYLHLHILWL